MAFDPGRVFAVRSRAIDALTTSDKLGPLANALERLLRFGDEDSQRLAFDLLCDQGLESVAASLAVEVVLAHAGLTVRATTREAPAISLHLSRHRLERMSDAGLHAFLDAYSAYAAPLIERAHHQSEYGVIDAAREAVLSALQRPTPISPEQIWSWLGWTEDRDGFGTEARGALQAHLRQAHALRREVQASVILKAGSDGVFDAAWRLARVNPGFAADVDDVVALLRRLGDRGDASIERIVEVALLARGQNGLPRSVRRAVLVLRPGDEALKQELSGRLKRRPDPYTRKHKQLRAAAARRRSRTYAAIRAQNIEHADSVRYGDFRFLEQAARVYLGRFYEFDRKAEPQVRVEEFLGAALAEDALGGFMASLRRDDLPTAAEIAQSHAESRQFYVEVVLVCGVAERLRRGLCLSEVAPPALEAAYMAWRRQSESNSAVHGLDVGKALDAMLLATPALAERFFRTSIEPQLVAKCDHVQELYQLTHEPRWAELSGRLAPEWLERHPDLPLGVQVDLLNAAIRHSDRRDFKKLVALGRARATAQGEVAIAWLATDFIADFEGAKAALAEAAAKDRSLLWPIRSRCGGRHETATELSLAQRAFIVETFGEAWPLASHPTGVSTGDVNPWDASEFIGHMINAMAGDASPEATEVLSRLADEAAPTYRNNLRHALALQRRLRRDREYQPAQLNQVLSVAAGALPETVDDMRAYFGDRVMTVQARMHATNTDMWEAYWSGDAPKTENFCRNRLIEHISGQLPPQVRFEPEMHMPGQKRADIAAIRGAIGLPVEIKRQWHPQVWDAPVNQLAARYMRDWHAHGRGVYIVLWFGEVPGKKLPTHPDGLSRPQTPNALRCLLIDRIPEALQAQIDVYVVDVSRLS